ncbi:MAG: hydantoinase/oxoprolinase family protein, partial [Alphaproteobacteria bacterium]|nr:hydantoinase/oxoprolinase family protein [Alphaproteobacteria bacterium]
GDPVEVVSFRVGVRAPPPPMPSMGRAPANGRAAPRSARLTERSEALEAGLLARAELGPDAMAGPLLIDDGSATIYAPPGWTAAADGHGNAILTKGTGP